jgi:UDP-N-acetylglucosamine--N-acetylmuramyl-(pentapeptide) pyrophosphoryl-undecaprenol N-acetylglucosamine transferase
MKVVFTGGGTGGHFYPIISIAEEITRLSKENKLITPEMYFFAPTPYNQGLLYDHSIKYVKVTAGKVRRYFSILNFFDIFKTIFGVIKATFQMFNIFPDVVFSKGGFGSFPAVLAARILGIPVFIHESDSEPGRVNNWAGKFATRVAVSYKETSRFFKEGKVAYTGQPILKERMDPLTVGVHEFFGFEENIPTIFVMGGSQGSEKINNLILDSLTELIKEFQIIHQTGKNNFEVVRKSGEAILLGNELKNRYKIFGYMNGLEIKMAAGAADAVISRGGSTIFEIASWGKPSIIIPLSEEVSHDQTKNAYSYAKSGSALVIEEKNLKTHIFISEIKRIIENKDLKEKMQQSAKDFFKKDASYEIAKEILKIALGHENL